MAESDLSVTSAAQIRERATQLVDSLLAPTIHRFLASSPLGSKLASILPMANMLGLSVPTPEKFLQDVRAMVATMPEADLLQHSATIRRAVLWATEGVE